MTVQISTLCALLVISSNSLCYGGSSDQVALATLKASVKFPEDSSEDHHQSHSGSDLYATATQQHATSVSSFKLFNAGAGAGGAGVEGSHYPYQQSHEESGAQSGKGFFQNYGSSDHSSEHQPLTATTYGPPKPMPYRNSHPSSVLASPVRRPTPSSQVYRHRGVVLPAKLSLPYGQFQTQGSPDLSQKYARPATDFRKYYKKAPEVTSVRKPSSPYKYVTSSFPDSGPKYTSKSPYKDDYISNYKTKQPSSSSYKSHTSESSNESYNGFSAQDTDPLPDPFSKEFYDTYYNTKYSPSEKAKENRYQQQQQVTKQPTTPPRNLSKYYKKPVNHFPAKPVSLSSSPYKSTPGKVFSDSLDYTRPDYHRSPSSAGSSSFSSSSFGGAASALAPLSTRLGSSEWTPINAPAGAVPARSYDISPPDLSKSHHQYPQHTYQPRHDAMHSTNTINYRTGASSEGIVSADVMVKQ